MGKEFLSVINSKGFLALKNEFIREANDVINNVSGSNINIQEELAVKKENTHNDKIYDRFMDLAMNAIVNGRASFEIECDTYPDFINMIKFIINRYGDHLNIYTDSDKLEIDVDLINDDATDLLWSEFFTNAESSPYDSEENKLVNDKDKSEPEFTASNMKNIATNHNNANDTLISDAMEIIKTTIIKEASNGAYNTVIYLDDKYINDVTISKILHNLFDLGFVCETGTDENNSYYIHISWQ